MADIVEQVSGLTVLTPVGHGKEDRLLDVLRGLARAEESPFGRSRRTHFARLVVVEDVRDAGPPPRQSPLASTYLLFSSSFDGPTGSYLESIRTTMAAEADDLWDCCVGYPGTHDPVSFAAYLLHNRLPATELFAAYGHAAVPRIQQALKLRDRLRCFVLRTQDMKPPELRAAFEAEFPA
jgi:hypothetical protein